MPSADTRSAPPPPPPPPSRIFLLVTRTSCSGVQPHSGPGLCGAVWDVLLRGWAGGRVLVREGLDLTSEGGASGCAQRVATSKLRAATTTNPSRTLLPVLVE
jgi:hypothetical protein